MDRLNRDDLFYLIADEKEDEALEQLTKCDNIDFQDKNDYSYLHIAVQSRLTKVVEYLLSNGATVDITDKFGRTPLMIAILGYSGDRTIVDILLKYGANLDLAVPSGMTARKLAVRMGLSI